MTNCELNNISREIDYISKKLSILDPDNVIENKLRERLFQRWDFLDYKLNCALKSAKRKRLRIIVCNNIQTS